MRKGTALSAFLQSGPWLLPWEESRAAQIFAPCPLTIRRGASII